MIKALFLLAALVAAASARTSLEERTGGILTCDLCKAVAEVLEIAFAASKTEEEVLDEMTKVCLKLLPQFNEEFCQGLVAQRFGVVVYSILKKLDGKLPRVCEFIGACQSDIAPKRQIAKVSRAFPHCGRSLTFESRSRMSASLPK